MTPKEREALFRFADQVLLELECDLILNPPNRAELELARQERLEEEQEQREGLGHTEALDADGNGT